MKTILMTVLAFLSLTVALAQSNNAERKAPRKMTHEEMTTKMVSQLKLNDAQKTKVAALNKEYQDYLMPGINPIRKWGLVEKEKSQRTNKRLRLV